jgi:hypothetical protein
MAVQAASGIRALSVLVLPHVRLGRRAERHGVGNVLVEEVELDLGAHGIVEEHLVARVLDILLLEIDAELLQMPAELDRARSLERMWSTLPLCWSFTIEPCGKRALTWMRGSSPS